MRCNHDLANLDFFKKRVTPPVYLALARKYRPADFSSVSGQKHVTQTLINSIKRKKIHHAYLFCGPRGVGKTSIARIFAKSLNCVTGPTDQPCHKCSNCVEISEGRSLSVREIDGASHNSVDNVRDLIETLRSAPAPGSIYKIYIIDEVHMLSLSAFNALLKSLEEPPANTVFILATTEVHKIPDTVISRCQRYDFRALAPDVIAKQIDKLAAAEGIEIDDEAVEMIARLSDGSMRDSQSLLDRVYAYSISKITAAAVSEALGIVEKSRLLSLSQMIFERSPSKALEILSEVFSSGVDPRVFLDDFATHWRELLISRFGGLEALAKMGISQAYAENLVNQTSGVEPADLQDLVYIAREGADQATRSNYPKYLIEALIVRMSTREPVVDLGRLVEQLQDSSSVLGKSSRRALGGGSQHSSRSTAKPTSTQMRTSIDVAPDSKVTDTGIASTSSKVGKMDWTEFVLKAAQVASPIMAENLKRIAVSKFELGVIVGSGPRAAVEYLLDSATLEKLEGLLNTTIGQARWAVNLTVGQVTEHGPLSIVDRQLQAEKKRKLEVIREVEEHPAVASLRKVFPGSTLSKTKVSTDKV